jgi:NADH-quinone oxidoreductase subunit E
MSLAETHADEIQQHLAKYPDKRSAVMPLLYIAQEEYGYLTREAIEEVAAILEMEPTQVYSIIGFYTMYYDRPKGKFLVQICNDLPCALRGADEFTQKVSEELGIEVGETTEDGLFTLENIMCIAGCDRAPVMQINFKYYEELDEEKVKRILDDLRHSTAAAEAFKG